VKKCWRIIIADDHEMVRRGVRSLVSGDDRWELVGEADNGRDAVELAAALKPDIAILDITMPLLNGLEAARRIRRHLPDCEVLVLTMHSSRQLLREVLDAGARGCMLKTDAGELIVAALEALSEHKPFFTSDVSDLLLGDYASPRNVQEFLCERGEVLTEREREIAQLIAEGKSSKEMASELGISVLTVDTHRANLMRKLDAHSASEVVRYAIRQGWTQA